MKRCPECRRDYYDDTLSFCLDDGSELLFGPAVSDSSVSAGGLFDDGPQTAILHDTASQPEAATKARRFATDQTAVLPSDITEQPRPKSYDKRLLFAPIALALVVLGGFLGYGYFSTGDQINSIAVLPFENSGGNPDSEYISDGLAESLIFRLSQLPDLKVSPRSSVFRYKGQMIDAELVGKELGVDAVMSGRIIQRGDSFTISVDLVDVRNRKTLWGEQFERKMSELLTTQREISAEIASKLRLQLSDDGERKLAKKYTDNNEAFQLYLQGRFQFAKRSKESLLDSIASYQRAIDADPKFALAHAAIADS